MSEDILPTNKYWSIYKNLEHEVLKTAEYIQFCDDQVDVYSIQIADLISRCGRYLEAISKELYERHTKLPTIVTSQNGKSKRLLFDRDCLALLNTDWHLSEKEISVTCGLMDFGSEENKVLIPFKDAGKIGKDAQPWMQAYQAVKHNCFGELPKATVGNLVKILGSLFILNLYHMQLDHKTHIDAYGHSFNKTVGSDIFSVSCCIATHMSVPLRGVRKSQAIILPSQTELQKSLYVVKYDQDLASRIKDDYEYDWNEYNNTSKSKAKAPSNLFVGGKLSEEEVLRLSRRASRSECESGDLVINTFASPIDIYLGIFDEDSNFK